MGRSPVALTANDPNAFARAQNDPTARIQAPNDQTVFGEGGGEVPPSPFALGTWWRVDDTTDEIVQMGATHEVARYGLPGSDPVTALQGIHPEHIYLQRRPFIYKLDLENSTPGQPAVVLTSVNTSTWSFATNPDEHITEVIDIHGDHLSGLYWDSRLTRRLTAGVVNRADNIGQLDPDTLLPVPGTYGLPNVQPSIIASDQTNPRLVDAGQNRLQWFSVGTGSSQVPWTNDALPFADRPGEPLAPDGAGQMVTFGPDFSEGAVGVGTWWANEMDDTVDAVIRQAATWGAGMSAPQCGLAVIRAECVSQENQNETTPIPFCSDTPCLPPKGFYSIITVPVALPVSMQTDFRIVGVWQSVLELGSGFNVQGPVFGLDAFEVAPVVPTDPNCWTKNTGGDICTSNFATAFKPPYGDDAAITLQWISASISTDGFFNNTACVVTLAIAPNVP